MQQARILGFQRLLDKKSIADITNGSTNHCNELGKLSSQCKAILDSHTDYTAAHVRRQVHRVAPSLARAFTISYNSPLFSQCSPILVPDDHLRNELILLPFKKEYILYMKNISYDRTVL